MDRERFPNRSQFQGRMGVLSANPGNAINQLAAAARYKPGEKRPVPDALILASRGDRIVHWRCSSTLEERWQWTMKLHPDAGHDLPLDDPEWIIQQIRNWLPR